jgi:hypothetical protein
VRIAAGQKALQGFEVIPSGGTPLGTPVGRTYQNAKRRVRVVGVPLPVGLAGSHRRER